MKREISQLVLSSVASRKVVSDMTRYVDAMASRKPSQVPIRSADYSRLLQDVAKATQTDADRISALTFRNIPVIPLRASNGRQH